MKPYYQDNLITIYCADYKDIVPGLGQFDLLLTDPPYGINWKPRINHQDQLWKDDQHVDIKPLIAIARLCCFWGGNYFADQLPISESWLIWNKRPAGFFENDPRTYATCEMAWTNFGGKPRIRTHVWDGGMRAGNSRNRQFCHPAQKPLELMSWCIELAGDDVHSIIDVYCGSGTTLCAAKDRNISAIGIEIEEQYCEIAAKRLSQEVLPLEISSSPKEDRSRDIERLDTGKLYGNL